ncbi:MAG: hypothetical protein HQK81_09305 [Desulfovibrionaceae bacterium]|nr:hypothetical protein [Desulfovibrionaceae bacterium]MBF0514236.1 hypothetical protein [Desulfovibrionaceae bacterium]
MKIDQIDPTNALGQSTAAKTAQSGSATAFSDLLNKEIQGIDAAIGADSTVTPQGAGIAGIGNVMTAESATAVAAPNQTELDAMDNMESILNEWENYAGTLSSGASSSGLKQANSLLSSIEDSVRKLKEGTPQLGKDSPLSSMVNELEVMTVTERNKLNRGDYS